MDALDEKFAIAGDTLASTLDACATQSHGYNCSITYPRCCNSAITLRGPEK
jgi:hypothetical protein